MRVISINCNTEDFILNKEVFDTRIAAQLNPLREEYLRLGRKVPKVDAFIIDASLIREADNYSCLALALLCEQLNDKFGPGGGITLKILSNNHFGHTFINSGYYGLISKIVDLNQTTGPYPEDESGSHHCVVKRIHSQDSIKRFGGLIKMAFFDYIIKANSPMKSSYKTYQERVGPFLTIGIELVQNILDHSQQKTGHRPFGFAAMQLLTEAIDIAVMDLGIGIPASLGQYTHSVLESISAIKLACQKKISRKNDEGRGLGLHYTKSYVIKLHGEMIIRSGKGNVTFNPSNDFAGEEVRFSGTAFFSGTQINLHLPLKKIGGCNGDEIEIYDL